MKKFAAVFVLLAVLFSSFVIPCGASCEVNITNKMPDIRSDCSEPPERDGTEKMLDNVLFIFFYELRITLKRSIIFANIAN